LSKSREGRNVNKQLVRPWACRIPPPASWGGAFGQSRCHPAPNPIPAAAQPNPWRGSNAPKQMPLASKDG